MIMCGIIGVYTHRERERGGGGEKSQYTETHREIIMSVQYIAPVRTQSNTYNHTALHLECCCVIFIEYSYICLSTDESYFRRQILLDSAHFGENVVLGDSKCNC